MNIEILLSHPTVLDTAVVAVPDDQWGEAVGAGIDQLPYNELGKILRRAIRDELKESNRF